MPRTSVSRTNKVDPGKLLVAVDFGTTFTGVAWLYTGQPRSTYLMQQWPHHAGNDEKVPTVIRYHEDGSHRWGFQIDTSDLRHEWFKLGLCPEANQTSKLSRQYPSRTALIRSEGEANEKIVIDYLNCLSKHIDFVLTNSLPDHLLRNTNRDFVLTVPAMWSDKAKERMRHCAEAAGLGSGNKLMFVAEPEAAGMYAIKELPPDTLKVGETVVLCDAGGGTVDLISYSIESLTPVPIVSETTPGSGQLCGSIYLDRIFAQYLEKRFRGYPAWTEDHQTEALAKFETDLKRNYTGIGQRRPYILPRVAIGLPDSHDLGIRRGSLEISSRDLRDIFAPVISMIVELVRNQISATRSTVRMVLLAGGFGRNEYLRKEVSRAINSGISVKIVPNGNTAIVRGALIAALSEKRPLIPTIRVESRKARRHYGTSTFTPFQRGSHDVTKKELDPFTGRDRVLVMRWFLNKGATLKESDFTNVRRFPFYIDQRQYLLTPEIPITIYACEDINNKGPPLYRDSTVFELAKLKADLSNIPKADLNLEQGKDGTMYYKIDFEIEMDCQPTSVTFTMLYNGKRYGTHQELI
ncbi:hypothetical protein AAFC00_005660 [Neodothiora populina]|uniref:Uncharacterized protein n=1 Tax=Neodothiora populina TaxID=2781224 RepID=A0ABR3PLN3_9PEZI